MTTPLHIGDRIPLPPHTMWAFGLPGGRRMDGCTAQVTRIGPPMPTCGLAPLVVLTCPEIPALPEWMLMAADREALAAQLDRARWMTARRTWTAVCRTWESTRPHREFAAAVATVTGLLLVLVVIAWQTLAPHGIGPAEALLGGLVLATATAAVCRMLRRRSPR
ncbi:MULTISPECIES: hypothetical protein [unclassified Crossiella]|uniref:hypothetical protein n=1 Tax=unclassified Crossiella TaxID=2620835 RepID=UPI001FFF458D|nr:MULTISPECIES: hypothetical protein [unclassified Crossiella]MCK2242184.1 hypothetical protein [Crossiella sp. S99.2]MCK2256087.1 hypothetical protein [Crossiella sp. S99.1]